MYSPKFAPPLTFTTRAGRSPLVGPITASRSAFGTNVNVPGMLEGAGLPWPRACARASIEMEKTIRGANRLQILFLNILSLLWGNFDVHLTTGPAALETTAPIAGVIIEHHV